MKQAKKLTAISFFLSLGTNLTASPENNTDIINALKNNRIDLLRDKKIAITTKEAPYDDVPSCGFGDIFLFVPVLVDYLETIGNATVAIVPPKPLSTFFKLCSDIPVIDDLEKFPEYIPLECRDLLHSIPALETFECKKRFLCPTCTWAQKEVTALVDRLKKTDGIPVIITRQSNHYAFKSDAEKKRFDYLNNRSISREELAEMLKNKPTHINVYNLQLEDQDLPDIPGTKKPTTMYPEYTNKMGAFVRDAILIKAVLRAGGHVVSIETVTAHLAASLVDPDDMHKNSITLLAKTHSCRWEPPFLRRDGSVTWSKNIELIIQKKAGQWTDVAEKLLNFWKNLRT